MCQGVWVFLNVSYLFSLLGAYNKHCIFTPLHHNPVSANWLCCVSDEQTQDSVQFSSSVISDSLWPHELQYTRPPCPSPTPGAYPNSCPLSQWCHPAISSSVVPFSSCLQSFPASGSYPVSQLFASGGQSIGLSVSASVLAMNIQDWLPLGFDWFDLLAVQRTLKSLLQHHRSKAL